MLFHQVTTSSKDMESTKNSFNQKIIFHYSYINWAWGYQNNGWFIDSLGVAKSYKVLSHYDWFLAQNGYISESALSQNYSLASTFEHEVEEGQLYEMYQLIDSAKNGNYSDSVGTGADIGEYAYYCYWWDKDRNEYKQVLLSLSGDWSQHNLDSSAIILDNWLKEINQIIVGIDNRESFFITKYTLLNYPNPFNPSTTIVFDLPKTSEVTLKIFNMLGEEVATLVSDKLSAGSYSYKWSRPVWPPDRPAGMASGIYFYRLSVGSLTTKSGHSVAGEAGEFIETKKMILMR